MSYTPTERNFDGIQFESLRKEIDTKFNIAHDKLSDCYYNKKPYETYGILNKETFNKLHGLIFLQRDIEFHEENMKKPMAEQIPAEKYNEIKDKEGILMGTKSEISLQKIQELKTSGIEISINNIE